MQPVAFHVGDIDFSGVLPILESSFNVLGGVMMGVSSMGNLIFNASFGVADVGSKPWTLDTITRIGSVTKVR